MKRSSQDALVELLETDPGKALALVEELSERIGGDPDLVAFRAEALAELGEFEESARTWAGYIERDPDYAEAYTERARMFIELGQLTAADSELQVAHELFGPSGELLFQRGFWNDAQGRFEQADRCYEEAAELEPMLDVPPRLPTEALAQALVYELKPGQVTLRPMPSEASGQGLGRLLDRKGKQVVVYQRNVERELPEEADEVSFAEVVLAAIEGLEAAN